MRKKLLPFITVLMLALFLGACNSEDVMPEIGSETNPELTERTISFTSSMPGEDDPATRVAAEELADRTLELTWETDDKIVLLFVQGQVEKHTTATVVSSADGKTGTFTVILPEDISETEDYTLYGVYGSAGVSTDNNEIVTLPTTGDLGDKILLYFKKEVTANAIGNVQFAHKGYVFTAKVAVTSGTVNDISLVADSDWAISSSDYQFNLKTGEFTTTATAANTIALENFAVVDGVATARSWFPATGTELPALRLGVNEGVTETNVAKPARTPVASKSYYLYAKYDGTDLVFDDKGTKENPFTVAEAFGAQGRNNVWVKGFIVGYKKSGGYSVDFTKITTQNTNIVIADNVDEADGTKALGVQLPAGDVRTDLNLADNPTMYKAEVLLKGNLKVYFGSDEGLKDVEEYVILDFGTPVFEADLESLDFLAVGDELTKTFKVSTNKTEAWTATSSDATWLTVSPAVGTGSADISITAATNEGAERTATVTLTPTSGGLTAITINVTQVAAPGGESKIYITDLRNAYVADGIITENHYIEGEVILNAEYGNANTRAAFIADGTAGISFFFAEEAVAAVPLGAKVKVNLLNATWSEFNGLKQINMSVADVEILEATATTPLEPRVASIQDVLDGKYQSELVQINAVEFDNVPTTYKGTKTIVSSDSKEIAVYTQNGATFADTNAPEGNGPFIGIVSSHFSGPQLIIRNTADLAGMTGERFPFIKATPGTLVFEKDAGSETIAVTANVAWTATSDAAWATVSPASGTNDGAIAVSVEANTGAEARTATITITGSDVTTTVSVTQAGSGALPPELLFPGSDFNVWNTFTSSLNAGVNFATESLNGGIGGSGALLIEGTQNKNIHVFTAKVPAGFSAAGKTKITFWIKGSAATKALSLNVYTGTGNESGTDYKCYNIPKGTTSDLVLDPTAQNSYAGNINTGGEWIKVTLDISTIAGQINTTEGQNLFGLKIGSNAVYDILVDDITIE